jgi:hypothetical protein
MMKSLIALLAVGLLAGCYTPPNSGRPGEEAYSESGGYTSEAREPNDRGMENKAADNLRQHSANGTISGPFR